MANPTGAQQCNQRPPLGTLADAWLPCRLVDFERDLNHLSSEQLEQKISTYQQACSNDPARILHNLQAWRQKYITAQQNGSAVDAERIQHICEAIRCKARLLQLKLGGKRFMRQALVNQGLIRQCVTRQSIHQDSMLLHCLSKLGNDVWAHALLPKLVEQGSAADVALTCIQLRDLCFSSMQIIKFDDVFEQGEARDVQQRVQSLPAHFPDCRTVCLELTTVHTYNMFPFALPTLARLQQLVEMRMTLHVCQPHPVPLTGVLYSCCTDLPRLRSLSLTLPGLQSVFTSVAPGRAIGSITQLKRLRIQTLHDQDAPASQYSAVQLLSSLTGLEHLAIWSEQLDDPDRALQLVGNKVWPVLPGQLLSSLTALTHLKSDIFAVESLSSISSCVHLQQLSICLHHDRKQLRADDWAGLVQLTRLAELRLPNAHMVEASPDACAALSKLCRLRLVGAALWSPAFLPALTACVQLTEICGKWGKAAAPVVLTTVLPQVSVLTGAVGLCPFGSFPNLLNFRGAWLADGFGYLHPYYGSLSNLECISQQCRSLVELDMTAAKSSVRLREHGQQAQAAASSVQVAAIRSLTSLQHLTCLKFTPWDDLDFVALMHACSVLEGHSLQELHLKESDTSADQTAVAWMQLRQLRALPKLFLHFVHVSTCNQLAEDGFVFISSLGGCKFLQLRLPDVHWSYDVPQLLRDAVAEVREAGLPAPHFSWYEQATPTFEW